ncbi:MAG TPA: energy transducer TonB [Terriglobales bacterium]|nr:energy transducer TonB [Terriglobales bacterium]
MPAFPRKFRCGSVASLSWLVLGLVILQVVVPARPLQGQTVERLSSRKTVQKTMPAYPEIAKELKLSGKVRIIAKVAPSGKVVATEIVGGHPVLARAAADAILQWRYEPGPQQTEETAVVSFEP